MLVTLTPNPSIDRTLGVEVLARGEVHRATSQQVDPGGKGVNVARATVAQGGAAVAVVPVGGAAGTQLVALATDEDVECVAVEVRDAIRSNVAVVEPDGTTTKLNEAGPRLSADELDALVTTAVGVARERGATWIAGCGSLPGDAPADLYARLVAAAHDAGLRVAVDTSGAPLDAVLDAGPDLVKPNEHELGDAVGREVRTVDEVVEAAREVCARGVATVLVSMGGDGAVVVTADRVLTATSARVEVASTVGAGDSLLAGFLGAADRGLDAALADGVASGTAAVQLPGTRMPTSDDLARARAGVTVHDTTTPAAAGTTSEG